MAFLHPEFLWGLLALAVPVIIHLFDFRRNRKVYFSDIRFLKQVKHASRKPLKLKQWLILASRLGFITFLVIVFAQPILPGEKGEKLSVGTKLIYIDNSLSMTASVNAKESALDDARAIGQALLKKFHKGQEVIVAGNEELSKFWLPQGVKEASDKIASLNYSDKPFSIAELSKGLKQYAARGEQISDVFIISDFQRSTFDRQVAALDTTKQYWLAPVPVESIENCMVDSVYQIVPDIASEDQLQIGVVIRNMGPGNKEDLPVKVFLGERQVSATTVTLPAYQHRTVVFALGKAVGFEQGYIQIEDYPVSFDNQFYFTIPRKKSINVLELTANSSSKYIREVFGNKQVFSLEQGDWRSIDYSLFDKADFVVLNQIEQPDPAFLDKVKSFVLAGGSVLVIPGRGLDAQYYTALFPSVHSVNSKTKKLQSPAKNDPFFTNILETSSGVLDMPQAKPVWGWSRDRSAVLSFEDNTPYLSEVSTNLFLLSAPLVDSISNVQTHALFVPVMYRLASRASSPVNRLFERVNSEYVDIDVDSTNVRELIKLKRGDVEIIPDKRKIGSRWRLTFPDDILSSGIYRIEADSRFEGYLAFNPGSNESQLEPLSQGELKSLFTGYKVSILDSYNARDKRITGLDDGIALWKYALIICLLFLLSEALLIRFL